MSGRCGILDPMDISGVDPLLLREIVATALVDYIKSEIPREIAATSVVRDLELHLSRGELEWRPTSAQVEAWMTPHGDVVERRG